MTAKSCVAVVAVDTSGSEAALAGLLDRPQNDRPGLRLGGRHRGRLLIVVSPHHYLGGVVNLE